MIEATGLFYTYPRARLPVIKNTSFSLERGEICALTGQNGCGKTTLTKLLVGIFKPDAGKISIDGEDIAGKSLFDIGRHIGYVFQNPTRQLFCATVFEEVAFGLRNLGLGEAEVNDSAARFIERFHLTHHRDDYPGSLSHGEKQRVVLAAVLALGTSFLILDEPTTGLDVRGRHELGIMLEELRKNGCGILIVSHERGFISRYATREAVMEQ